MSTTTQRLGLFKYDTVADSQVPFNIDDALNYNWDIIDQKVGPNRNVGEIIASSLPLTDAGLHLLDGSLLQYGSYKEFIDYIADLYAENPSANYFTTEADWQTAVTTYGVCGKFVYDDVNNTVRLPKITGKLDGTTDTTALGDLAEQYVKLPNITGYISIYNAALASASGAFYRTDSSTTKASGSNTSPYPSISFDASRSSSVYSGNGTDTKIHEQAINVFYYIIIATSTKTDIQVDIDEITTDLNSKCDTDLSNMSASQSVKNEIISWGMPDYTAGISISSNTNWTCPSDGIVVYQDNIKINGTQIFTFYAYSGYNTANSMTAPVSKGDIIYVGGGYFYPMKGAN